MMPTVEIDSTTVTRLQAIAVPLTDTFDSVVNRLLDHWDATKANQPKVLKPGEPMRLLDDNVTMVFDPAYPPNLRFTNCLQITVDGVKLAKGDTYWNNMLHAVIRAVSKRGKDAQAIYDMLFVNAEMGPKEDNGYKFLADVGVSIQGLESNAAFRQVEQLAKLNSIPFQVWFTWQEVEKASYPGKRGYFEA